MKQIQLTKNQFAIVDDDLFDYLNRLKWHYNNGYAKTYQNGRHIRMHRLIMKAEPSQQIDHRNGNKLDNRRENLRFCTTQQNNRNAKIRKDNTSGYKGVSLDKSTGHWKPLIYVDGKAKTCGQFKSKRHAALAYDMWSVFFYGEFANTNFTSIYSK